LGSGFLIDLSRFGLPWEPTVQATVGAGTDIVTFSGDKLLGGSQAGIIIGKRIYIDRMKKNPLTRAIRIDKMTVAALEATLRLYLDEEQALVEVPTLKMLTITLDQLRQKASELAVLLREVAGSRALVEVAESTSAVGGGAMPTAAIPTAVVVVQPGKSSAGELQEALRRGEPAVMGRVQEEKLLLDVRTIASGEFQLLAGALAKALK
jgi:L-seryl-tRNA(Ser) seleniumtransferase